MGDSKVIEGISFEPVENSKFKCSVCSKIIVNVLLRAHANSHGNAISQLKPPPAKVPEIVQEVPKANAGSAVSQLKPPTAKAPEFAQEVPKVHAGNTASQLKPPTAKAPETVQEIPKAHTGNANSQLKPPESKAAEIIEEVPKAKAVKKVSLQVLDSTESSAANKETIGKVFRSFETKNPAQKQGNFETRTLEVEEKKMAAGNGTKVNEAKSKLVCFETILNNCLDERVVVPAKNGRKTDDKSGIRKKIKLSRLAVYLKIAKECEVKLERVSGIFRRFKMLRYLRGIKMWKKFRI